MRKYWNSKKITRETHQKDKNEDRTAQKDKKWSGITQKIKQDIYEK